MRIDRRPARQATPAVLIVEDDPIVADAAADAIGAAGYRAIQARDGWQALEALAQERPALLLVDLFLPGMSGTEFLRFVKINPSWSHIPRVIMTGANDPMIGIREDAAVFYKPLDLDSLIEVVKRYVDRARPRLAAFTAAGDG
jgi:two-component system cell cycle response regulator DivK